MSSMTFSIWLKVELPNSFFKSIINTWKNGFANDHFADDAASAPEVDGFGVVIGAE